MGDEDLGQEAAARQACSGRSRVAAGPRFAGPTCIRLERALAPSHIPSISPVVDYMSVDDEGVESDVKIVHVDAEEGKDVPDSRH